VQLLGPDVGFGIISRKGTFLMNTIPERLQGDGFFLRRWEVKDAEWYVHSRDDEIFQWTTEKRDLTIAETEVAILKINASMESLCFAIVDLSKESLLGNIALVFNADRTDTAEMMYWLAATARGRGIATQAVTLLSDWAFQSFGLQHIILKIRSENLHSQRVAERSGFRQLEPGEADYIWFERMKPIGSKTGSKG
jgi:[ribosomal protein S5]-alanine N-acetyltransferase